MPDELCPSVPYDPGDAGPGRPIDVRTVTLHRTIGRWAGDYSVGKHRSHDQGTFQFLIGQGDGEWVQFYPVGTFCSHAAGANLAGPGIEISGQNGEPLTDWQITALGHMCRWLVDEWGITPTFTDGDPRVWIDQAGPSGFVTHRHVDYPPDRSYLHHDFITDDEFTRALGTVTAAPTRPGGDAMFYWGTHPTKPGQVLGLLVESGVIVCQLEGPPDVYGLPPSAGAWINGAPGVGAGAVPCRLVQSYVLAWLLQTHDDVVNRRYVAKTSSGEAVDPAVIQAAVRAELDRTVLAKTV